VGKRRREKYFITIAKHDCQLNYLRASPFLPHAAKGPVYLNAQFSAFPDTIKERIVSQHINNVPLLQR
jgi:hypothetical protein